MRIRLTVLAFAVLHSLFAQQAQPQAAKPTAEKERLCVVQGQVLNLATGEPVRKADIKLAPSTASAFLGVLTPSKGNTYAGVTDGEGKFSIEDVAAGSYTLSSKRTGFLETRYGARKPQAAGTTLTLSAGQTLKDLQIKMTPQGVIAGKVLDDEGEPVQNSMVQAQSERYMRGRKMLIPVGTAMTNDRGEYRVGNLDPGKYVVLASTPLSQMAQGGPEKRSDGKPETGLVAVYFPNVLDSSQAARVELGPGTELSGHDMRLQRVPAVRVKGKLLDGTNGKPVGNMMVSLLAKGSFIPRNMVMLGADGKFDIGGVAPGTYTLLSINPSPVQMTVLQTLEVGDKTIEDLVVTSAPPPSVTGTVTIDGDKKTKLAGMRVTIMPAEGLPVFGVSTDTVQDDGAFTLKNVSPGKYQMQINGTPDGAYIKAVRLADQDVLGKDLDWSAGAGGTIQIVLGTDAAQVTGKVEKDNAPATGVTVALLPEDTSKRIPYYYKVASTDQLGNFTVKGLAPMAYKAFAWEDAENGAHEDPEFIKPIEGKGVKVTADAGGSATVQLKVITEVKR